LRAWQYADYFEGQRDRAFQRLLVSLKRRADGLGLVAEEVERKQIEEQGKRETAEKNARQKLELESVEQAKREAAEKAAREKAAFAAVGRVSNPTEPVVPKQRQAKSLTYGFWGIGLLVFILVGFGLNSLIKNKNTPVATVTVSPTETPIPLPTLVIGSTQVSEKDGMTLLAVPAGEFTMGDSDTGIYQVDVKAFWIDQTEVTNAMFKKCVDAGECTLPSDNNHFSNSSYAKHPVVYVDWKQANAYCSWVDRRLPTEAEWEKAARGADGRTYPWGETIDRNFANYGQYVDDTSAVGSYESGKSPYGAYDMAGNVYEWVSSLYKSYPYDASDGREDSNSFGGDRVLRGGSWYVNEFIVRSAFRVRFDPTNTYVNFGFRCASSLP
jgi:serine/threonine-protein kinase